MELFKHLMQRQDSQWLPTEVFITVMDGVAVSDMNRSRNAASLNALMGDTNWRHLTKQGLTTPQRRSGFIELYIKNLKRNISKALTLKFGMKNDKDHHIYHLIYLTCHIRGIQTMKRAMWKRTQNSTEMVFSEWFENCNEGGNIVDKLPDQVAQCLYVRIKNNFGGKTVFGNVIDEYIWLETPYISNVKRELKQLLKPYAINTEKAFERIEYRFPLVESIL